MSQAVMNIALVGNPNSGKTSLFNALTGLNQKVGNFPGVTVDKKLGTTQLPNGIKAKVIDLPGTYSLYPKSADEYVAYELLLNPRGAYVPVVIVVVVDATMLQRNLLFCSQIIDLKHPVVVALTMVDLAEANGYAIDADVISDFLGVPVVAINPRIGEGTEELKQALQRVAGQELGGRAAFIPLKEVEPKMLEDIKMLTEVKSDYAALHLACANERLNFLTHAQSERLQNIKSEYGFKKAAAQGAEVMARYNKIEQLTSPMERGNKAEPQPGFTAKLDKILLHRFWGNIIMLLVLLLMFQSIFWLASYPMDWIESAFASAGAWLEAALPQTWWADLLVNGLWAGLGGIVIFVPQIAILFGIITILEDTGYMARITFLTDRLLKSVGMNGKAAMPMISGLACAIPAVMATRIIENKKERLIAILVTPLMSCSARLPVYIILISLVIPNETVLGFLSLQGLVMLGLYLLGFLMALIVAKVMSWLIKGGREQLFLMELPIYRAPRWKNAFQTMVEKAKIFVVDAGKIIMLISIVLWALSKFGPGNKMDEIQQQYDAIAASNPNGELDEEQQYHLNSLLLENSYIGRMGKAIEPVIRPLGYDWKIGIALITSFAAREAYVGTIATLYNLGGDVDEEDGTLRQQMASATFEDGKKVYTLATGTSLLVFYVFAMQCMSTLAIVKRETKSWKWPIIQFIYMGILAYICALITFNIFN